MKVTVSRHRDGPEIVLDGFTGQPMAEPMFQQRYDIADRALRGLLVQHTFCKSPVRVRPSRA